MHIKYQRRGVAVLKYSGQQQPGKKCLAGTTLTEYSHGPFDQFSQVQAQFGLHIQRAANPKVTIFFAAEYRLDVLLGGSERPREVGGYTLSGCRFLLIAHHIRHRQLRQHRYRAKRDNPLQCLDHERVVCGKRCELHSRVGTAKAHVRDDSEKPVISTLQRHECADLDLLHRHSGVELYLNAIGH